MSDRDVSFEKLSQAECYDLIRRVSVGRIVMVHESGPMVFPVNYVVDGRAIVFRTDRGTKLELLGNGLVAFQVDEVDLIRRSGWSVLLRGVAYEATRWESLHLDVSPWAPGDKSHWVRVVPRHVSGRRIALPEPTLDPRTAAGYV